MDKKRLNIGLKAKIIGLLSFVLLVLLVIDIVWTYNSQKSATEAALIEESKVLVQEMDAVWKFISVNQYTINHTSDGSYEYKGLHCAIAGKSVAAFFSLDSDYTLRFTNVAPRNRHNEPDEYELQALEVFAQNEEANDYYGFAKFENEEVFRYVSAMKVEESCLECHGQPKGEIDLTGYEKEGWGTGDLAGAVSVVVPTELYFSNMREAVFNNVLFFLAIMLSMVVMIYFAITRLITNPLTNLQNSFEKMSETSPSIALQMNNNETNPLYASREIDELFERFNSMASSLSNMYSTLESEVEERTVQLSDANIELERQRKHVEEINEKLKQENLYKSDFLAIVSHELRTPLTSILAFTDLMSEHVRSEDEIAQQQLEEIEKNGQILLEMVDNVLETARIQAGSERLNIELIDLHDIVGYVEASNASIAKKNGVHFSTRVDVYVPLIMSDWEKVRRILVNLVSNAIKFTPAGGSVLVTVESDLNNSLVVIKVIDSGIGIPDDKQKLVFERFTQENMSTVRRYGGSGLGLSLVKDLASMLGGDITVESHVDEGSTFTLTLPVDQHSEENDDQDNVD